MNRQYSKDEVIERVRRFKKKHGKYPRRRDFCRANELPNTCVIQTLFNLSYLEFMKEYFNEHNYRRHTKASILNDIRNFKEKHGRYPTQVEIEGKGLPGHKTIEKHFNLNYSDFILKYFNYKTKSKFDFKGMTLKEFIEYFKTEYPELKAKSIKEYEARKRENLPSESALRRHYNTTYNELLTLAGFEINETIEYSTDDIIEEIKRVKEKLNKTPSTSEFEKHSKISIKTLKKRFGNYNKALKTTGVEDIREVSHVSESDEELIDMYKAFCIKAGKMAVSDDLDESKEIYNSDVFILRFGSMYNVYEQAGYDVKRRRAKKYNKEQITRLLLEEYQKKGSKLTNREIASNPRLPSCSTIMRHFKSTEMKKIWEEIL